MDMTGDQLHHYLNDLGMTCDQMVLRCNFEGNVRDCREIFTPTITDEGQCCSFNIMPEPLMFRTQVVKVGTSSCTYLFPQCTFSTFVC